MDTGAFHVLFDIAQREPLLFVSVVIGVPLLLIFLIIAAWKQLHPLIAWLVLSSAFFGFSQIFPENRNDRVTLAIVAAISCAALTWYWYRHAAPGIRQKFNSN